MREPSYLYGDPGTWAEIVECLDCDAETQAGYPCDSCFDDSPVIAAEVLFPDPEDLGVER